jgi:hypothetical protein
VQSAEKNKKKTSAKKSAAQSGFVTNSKAGFVTNSKAPPRPISNDESESDFAPAKKKSSGKKPPPPQKPKVVPKKSATATAKIIKGGINSSKSKKYIDTESDSDIDDSTSKVVQRDIKKKIEKKEIQQVKTNKSSVFKKEAPKKVPKSKPEIDSNSDDTDTSLIRDLPKSGRNSPLPPSLTPQKQKPKQNVKPQKKPEATKYPKSNKPKEDSRKVRDSSIESIGNSSLASIDSLDSDTADSDASIEQKMRKIGHKKGQGTSPKVNKGLDQ